MPHRPEVPCRCNPATPAPRIALSKLEAGAGAFSDAVASAKDACLVEPIQPEAFDQLASLYADAGDAAHLDEVVAEIKRRFPHGGGIRYYEAASRFLRGDLPSASTLAQQSIEAEPGRAASHNLWARSRRASDTSNRRARRFRRRSVSTRATVTTYTNLALLELSSGNNARAAGLFAEALSLDPSSDAARKGLARTASSVLSR